MRSRAFLLLISLAASSLLPALALRPPPPGSVRLAAVGDILLDRGVGRRIARHGPDYPFAGVRERLRSADLVFGNLECPISADGVRAGKPFSFRARPDDSAALDGLGSLVLSLANNHTLDCGRTGLTDTIANLRSRGLRWCGAGPTAAAAASPCVVTSYGLRVGFVAFCDVVQDSTYPRSNIATVASSAPSTVRAAIAAASRRSDVVVASFHWGVEYDQRPSERQRRLARLAAQSGAALVLGHHPHVLQGLEWISGKEGRQTLVAYSLGNFVFDPLRRPACRTAILEARLSRTGVQSFELVPCEIVDCRPVIARGDAGGAIATRMAELSREMGTRMSLGRGERPTKGETQ